MRVFAKFVFICNCCFVISVVLNKVEQAHKRTGNFNGVVQINGLESSLVILGYGAIFVNFIFNIFQLILLLSHSRQVVAPWLYWINFIFLILQLYLFLPLVYIK